jgi:hypothetical protein
MKVSIKNNEKYITRVFFNDFTRANKLSAIMNEVYELNFRAFFAMNSFFLVLFATIFLFVTRTKITGSELVWKRAWSTVLNLFHCLFRIILHKDNR